MDESDSDECQLIDSNSSSEEREDSSDDEATGIDFGSGISGLKFSWKFNKS